MAENAFIARCSSCGAKNRIPASRRGEKAVCGRCKAPLHLFAAFPERAIDVDERSFGQEVINFPGPVAVLYWAPWCGHCRRMLPVFEELAVQNAGSIKFVKIELDKNPYLASQYQVQSVPTTLLFREGRLINRFVGGLGKDQLEYNLRAVR
ncbi:MAG: thioredoxin fold domain-containing protein [Desulfobacteraceae bacterium]|nr:thioredoxin fold domain-containing protein [Desulfobacteraceae bacterium]